MRTQTLQFLDRFLGKPVCLLLTLLRYVAAPFQRLDPRPPKSLVFIKLTEQGATVLACAAVQRAVELVGRANVYFWVFDKNRPILDILDLVPPENVFEVRADSVSSLGVDLLRTLAALRRLRVDAAADLELFARGSAALAYLSGARLRVGLHRFSSEGPYRGDLMTHRMQYNPHLHVAAHYLSLVEALTSDPGAVPLLKRTVTAEFAPPRFDPAPVEVSEIEALLVRKLGARPQGPVVLLNPNTSDLLPLRQWPAERFAAVGRRVLEVFPDASVLITGPSEEAAAAARVAAHIGSPRAVSLAGETSLRQLIVLYTLADVLVTSDGGPAHFASLTDIDTVALFGPETPALYGPLGSRVHVLWSALACSPCVSALNHRVSPCRNNVCMQSLTEEQVARQVIAVLRRRSASASLLPLLDA